MGLRVLRGVRVSLWGVAACLIVAVGVFQPWLWRGYKPYSEFNPRTRRPDIRYHLVTTVSPFYTSIIREGEVEATSWFMSPETSLSGILILSAASLSAFEFDRGWIKVALSLTSSFSFLFFFLSLGGGGLGLGSVTHLGWGSTITLIGITFMFLLSLIKMISR